MSLIAVALAAAAALGLYAGWVEPRALRIRHARSEIPGLAAPLRAVVIGDLQPYRHHWSGPRLRAAFARAAAERPDIVLWLGDYFNAPTRGLKRALEATRLDGLYARACTPMAEIAAAMGTLTAPMGAFAVLGNHDWAWDGEACAAALREAGVTVLIGETAEAVHPKTGARLTVIGLDDASSLRPPGWDRLAPAWREPAILLTHAPDIWGAIDRPPALTLAGHSHGGQVLMPLIGASRLPYLGASHVRGWYRRGEARLLVTAGLGSSGPPVRLGVPPEIVVLDLAPGQESGASRRA